MRSERNQLLKVKRGHVAGAVPIARAGFRSESESELLELGQPRR